MSPMLVAERRLFVVAAGVAVALVAGCGEDETSVPISGGVVAIGDSELRVTLGCYDSGRVEVEEGPEQIELRGFAEGKIDGDCATTATANLEEPLGDRMVIDGKTGRSIEVRSERG